jgi:glyoxylase-like metal-dependent hydrolase (beta-lactamase superfamily II)
VIEHTRHDDVDQCKLTWWRSRLIGFAVHVFIVRDVLIDTGFPAVAHEVTALARSHRVRGALVTHQHEDHAGNVEPLAAAGVPLGMSAATREIVSRPQSIGFYRRFTWRSMPPLAASDAQFAEESLELVPTPGHSADHHAVWDHRTDTLFAGDLFLGVKVRVAHSYEQPRQLVASLRAMAGRRPRRVFCAHRGLVQQGASALTAKADWLDDVIERIGTLHVSGADATEIRQRVLGNRRLAHWFSAGDYSPDNIVRAVIRDLARG